MEIVTGENNKILRQKSKEVIQFNKELSDLIKDMKKIMEDNNGIGLAAIQVGIPKRVIVCEVNNKFYSFINPVLVKSSPATSIMEEGCLSLPGIFGEVERPEKITIKAMNSRGKTRKVKAFGLLARVIQHEMDHLDGILFIDKAKNIKCNVSNSDASNI